MEKKVSVVVPAYNAAKYIKTCVDSLVDQTLQEIEIIVVDDGSTDETGRILDEYQEHFPEKVVVIHTQNKGPGAARNVGMKVASGEYIGFVDGDDWVDTRMFETLYRRAVQGFDVVVCNSIRTAFPGAAVFKRVKAYRGTTPFKKIDFVKRCFWTCAPWNKLFAKELIQRSGVEWPEIWYEDYGFVPAVMTHANKPAYIDEELYYYRLTEGSITANQRNDDRPLCKIQAYQYALQRINQEYREAFIFSLTEMLPSDIKLYSKLKYHFHKLIVALREDITKNTFLRYQVTKSPLNEYLNMQFIPPLVHIVDIGEEIDSALTKKIQLDVQKYYADAKVSIWTRENLDPHENPTISEAYDRGDYAFVNDYFKLKILYRLGGICFDPTLSMDWGITQLCFNRVSFGALDTSLMHTKVISAFPKQRAILDLIGTYEFCPYGEKFIPLSMRMVDYLEKVYGKMVSGRLQKFSDDIMIYPSSSFLYRLEGSINISAYTGEDIALLDKYREFAYKELNNTGYASKLEQKIKQLEQRIKVYENSTSWKITKPIRVFGKVFAKIRSK